MSERASSAKSKVNIITPDNEEAGTESGKPLSGKTQGIGHWMTFSRSPEYLSMQSKDTPITEEELQKHTSDNDMWMALNYQGKMCVFDVSKFAKFHPGGYDLIKDCAGRDASFDFRISHAYVNLGIISRLQVGVLTRDPAAPSHTSNFLSPTDTFARPAEPAPRKSNKLGKDEPKWNWEETDETLTLLLTYPAKYALLVDHCSVLLSEKESKKLQIHNFISDGYHILSLKLLANLPELSVGDVRLGIDGSMRITLQKTSTRTKSSRTSSLGAVVKDAVLPSFELTSQLPFLHMSIMRVHMLNHDCVLLTCRLPSNTCLLQVPLGHHVFFQATVEGVSDTRPYTPVVWPLHEKESENKQEIHFIVKLYEVGFMSQVVRGLHEGDSLQVSLPAGHFVTSQLNKHGVLVMLAAGSGITPMLRVLHRVLHSQEHSNLRIELYFFNKREKDRMLGEEFLRLTKMFPERFVYEDVLSAPSAGWSGPSGRISVDLCKGLFRHKMKDKPLFLICGPKGFHDSCKSVLTKMKFEDWFEFTG